jgi:hypothetical protein
MTPFYTKFRHLAFREMRTVIVRGRESIPDGPYGFLEFYCNEVGCDCRRVVFHVIRPDTGTRVWASINFGWESPVFYQQWSPGDPEFADMAGATLDPLNAQSEHSDALLTLFQEVVAADPDYVQRLQRHYRLFKRASEPKAQGGRKRIRAVQRSDDGS